MNFPIILPMGTIMTCCMIVGVIIGLNFFPFSKLPISVRKALGWLILAAGIWNAFWHGLRFFSEFWGYSAFASGLLMIATALLILWPSKLPATVRKAKPLILVLLACYATLYAVTIYRL